MSYLYSFHRWVFLLLTKMLTLINLTIILLQKAIAMMTLVYKDCQWIYSCHVKSIKRKCSNFFI